MKKIKVLYIISSLRRGGAERLLVDICNELHKRAEIDYLILSLSSINEYIAEAKELNIKNINATVQLSIFKKTKTALTEYIEIITSFKPDIIHSHLYVSEIVSREVIFPNISYISHLHGYETQYTNFTIGTILSKRKLINWFEKRRLIKKYKKCNNHFIAVSNYVNNFFINAMPSFFLDKITLLPNAINFSKFYNENCFLQRNIIKNNSEEIKLINTGSFDDNKNHIFLIDVVEYLKKKKNKVKLIILGDGPNKRKIENIIKERKLDNEILIMGKVDNVSKFLYNSTVYVHAAKYEAFGLSLLEAMASGLPVVSLDGKGNRDVVKNGVNGFMLDKPDVIMFAEKIIELATKPDLYNSMSENAVKFAADFDIKNYVDKLMQLYNKILHQ